MRELESLDGALLQLDSGERRAGDVVTRQTRIGGGIPDGIPLSHAVECEWWGGVIMGPSGILHLRRGAQQAGESPPRSINHGHW